MLASKRVRSLTPHEIAVYFRGNADFSPYAKPRLILYSKALPKELGIDKSDFTAAVTRLIASGLIERTKDAVKPGGMGSRSTSRAAEYDIPQRHKGGNLRFDQGDKRRDGYWRVDCGKLRAIAATVKGPALRILAAFFLAQHRHDSGAVQVDRLTPISVNGCVVALADTPNPISKSTVKRALADLRNLGLIKCHKEAAGSAPAEYVPDGDAAAGLPWKKMRSQPCDAVSQAICIL